MNSELKDRLFEIKQKSDVLKNTMDAVSRLKDRIEKHGLEDYVLKKLNELPDRDKDRLKSGFEQCWDRDKGMSKLQAALTASGKSRERAEQQTLDEGNPFVPVARPDSKFTPKVSATNRMYYL